MCVDGFGTSSIIGCVDGLLMLARLLVDEKVSEFMANVR